VQAFSPLSSPKRIDIWPGTIMDMGDVDFPFVSAPTTGDANQKNLVIPDSNSTIGTVGTICTTGTIGTGEKAMPWKPSDARKHTKKANTPERQRLWASIANRALKDCDGEAKECEASAIRAANAAMSSDRSRADLKAAKQKALDDLSSNEDDVHALREYLIADAALSEKAGDDGEGEMNTCTCPNCKESAESDVPCQEAECPNCGGQARGGDDDSKAKGDKPDFKPKGKKPKPKDDEEEEEDDEEEDEEKPKKPKYPKKQKAGRRFSSAIMGKLRDAGKVITDLISHGDYADQATTDTEASPDAIKSIGTDEQGRDWFMIWPTNAYKDREGEFFATPAIEDYVNRHTGEDVKGRADFLHVPGSEFGTIRHQAVVADHFVCQLGTYDDTPAGKAFKRFFDKYPDSHPVIAPGGWGASHEFNYEHKDRDDGVFTIFDITKSTVLPLDKAANVYNPQPKMGGFKMNKDEQHAFNMVGEATGVPDLAAQVVALGQNAKAKLDGEQIQRKSVEEQVSTESKSQEDADSVKELAEGIAEHLGLSDLSKAFESIVESNKALGETVAALQAKVAGVEVAKEEEVNKSLGTPRYAWQASQAPETVTDKKRNVVGNFPNVTQRLASNLSRGA